jgi:hypothetical protein
VPKTRNQFYHFFTPLYGTDSLREDFFLRNVVQQMAEWHGHTEQLPYDLNELRALYQRFLDGPLVLQRGFEKWCNVARQPSMEGGQHDEPDRDRAQDGRGDPRY